MFPDAWGSDVDYYAAMGHDPDALFCDFCVEERPAFKVLGDGRPICHACDENQQEAAWVRRNEEAQ